MLSGIIRYIFSHPIILLTHILPTLLVGLLLAFLIDFLLYYIALSKYFSDDDKGDKKDD